MPGAEQAPTHRVPVATGAGIALAILPAFFGIAPFVTILLGWPSPGSLGSTSVLRSLSIPVLLAELLVIVAALLLKSPRISLPRVHQLMLITLIAVALATAFLVAVDPVASVMRTVIWIVHLLFGAALYSLAAAGHVRIEDMMKAIFMGFLLSAAAMLVLTWSHPSPTFDWVHGLPGFDHLRRIGYYSAAVGALAIGDLALRRHGARSLPLAATIAAFAMIFWSGSRGGLVGLVGTWVLIACLNPDVRRLRAVGIVALCLVAGAALSMLAVTSSPAMGLERAIGITTEAGSGAALTSGRTVLWSQALSAITERPLFGHGEAQAKLLLPMATEGGLVHPHNALLQFLLAWGLIGTALIAALSLPWFAWSMWRSRQPGSESLPWLAGITALLVFSGLDGTLYHVLPLALAAVFAAMAHASASGPSSSNLRRSPETAAARC